MTKNIETFLRNNMGYELIEIVAAAIMLIYLWLEYKASIWLWPVGVVISLFYIYIYFVNKFYADMGINIYYLVASAYGWFRWWKSESVLKRKSLRSALVYSYFDVTILSRDLLLLRSILTRLLLQPTCLYPDLRP